MSKDNLSRREMLRNAALAGLGLGVLGKNTNAQQRRKPACQQGR